MTEKDKGKQQDRKQHAERAGQERHPGAEPVVNASSRRRKHSSKRASRQKNTAGGKSALSEDDLCVIRQKEPDSQTVELHQDECREGAVKPSVPEHLDAD